MSSKPGYLFIISGASGTGKTTLCKILERDLGIFFSVSATTRPMRAGEVNERDYYFLDKDVFREMEKNHKFLETALVHDHWYGTPREPIESRLIQGENVLLDLDTQGGLRLRNLFSNSILIFIMPPTIDDLATRLQARGTDSQEVITRRIQRAREELQHSSEYDHVVINRDLRQAEAELKGIIQSYKDP